MQGLLAAIAPEAVPVICGAADMVVQLAAALAPPDVRTCPDEQ